MTLDHFAGDKEIDLQVADRDLLREAAEYLRLLPQSHPTKALAARIESHLADPVAGNRVVFASRWVGESYSASGAPVFRVAADLESKIVKVRWMGRAVSVRDQPNFVASLKKGASISLVEDTDPFEK